MELFTATGKLKKFSIYKRCSMCAPRVIRHTSIRYPSSCHKRINMIASIFFPVSIIPVPFRHDYCIISYITLLSAYFSTRLMTSYQFNVVTYKERTGRINVIKNICVITEKKGSLQGPQNVVIGLKHESLQSSQDTNTRFT
jgi:hypothetical protein